MINPKETLIRGKVGALCDLRGANGWATRWPIIIIIIERDILPPSPRKGRNHDFKISREIVSLKVNELESNAVATLSLSFFPSLRRIETRALDDFRVIEHVHSFFEDFDDRAVCFDDPILSALVQMNKRRSIAQNERIYIYIYFTETI